MDFLGGAVPPAVAARLAAAHNPASIQAEVIAVDGGMDRGTTDSDDGKKEKASASFTVKVSTTHDGYNSYTVKRRYRQFDALQTQLKAQFKGVPELPAKDSFARKDGAYLEKRRSGLDVYLRALVADPVLAACEDTRQFLELASATQLIDKLHEKDHFVNALVHEKDQALEELRKRLSALTAEDAKKQAEITEARGQLDEATRAAAAAAAAATAREEAARAERETYKKAAEASIAELRASAAEAAEAAATAAAEAQGANDNVEKLEREKAAVRDAPPRHHHATPGPAALPPPSPPPSPPPPAHLTLAALPLSGGPAARRGATKARRNRRDPGD